MSETMVVADFIEKYKKRGFSIDEDMSDLGEYRIDNIYSWGSEIQGEDGGAIVKIDGNIYYIVIDAHSMELILFDDIQNLGDWTWEERVKIANELYEGELSCNEIENLLKVTISNDGMAIVENNFDVEGYELFWKYWRDDCGGGYDRFYINEDGNFLVYSNCRGWIGDYGDDINLLFEEFYDWAKDEVNDFLDIDEEKYFEVSFNDLIMPIKIEDEFKLFVTIPVCDCFCAEEYIMDIETKETFEYVYDYVKTEDILEEEEMAYDVVYVGSEKGEINFRENDEDEWDTTDFGFVLPDWQIKIDGKILSAEEKMELLTIAPIKYVR